MANYTSLTSDTDFGLIITKTNYNVDLDADVDTVFTVPGNGYRYKALIYTHLTDLWYALGEVANNPSTNAFVLSTSALIPFGGLCREVVSGEQLHFKSVVGGDVSIVLYTI